jgi:2'-5' RNA ligase
MGERLFLAIPLTDDVRRSLHRSLPSDLPGKIVPAPTWHLTLKFLGDTAPELRDALGDVLRSATLGRAFEIGFRGLAAFPRADRARTIWIGVTPGAEHLERLAKKIEERCVAIGFAPDARPYAAHLTVARLDPPRAVDAVLAKARPFEFTMPVSRVVLYRSVLGNGPPRYEEVFSFPLGFA